MAPKKKKPARSAKGSSGPSGSGSSRWLYLLLALIAVGLAWVLWPLFSPPQAKRADTARELQEMTRNPNAEVLNPPGDALKKK